MSSRHTATRIATAALLLVMALTGTACTRLAPYYRGGRMPLAVAPADAQIDHRLILLGDAGDADPGGEPALHLLAKQIRLLPDRTTVAFLGDNVYERGMPEPEPEAASDVADAANVVLPKVFNSRQEAERLLDAQIDPFRGTTARGIFIPGNHDWDPFAAGGWKRVLAQENYMREASARGAGVDVRLVPEGGCPGPVSIPLGKRGMLIVIDTEWFLELAIENDVPNDKPCPENNPTGCKCTTDEDVVAALIADLRAAAREGRWAIVAAHHPLNSAGPHGGYVEPLTHLFPLRMMRHYLPWYMEWVPFPGLGTMAVVARQRFSPSPQDASNAKNIQLRKLLRDAMAEAERQNAPTLVYAAGHDHSLQVFRSPRGPRYTVVSGLASTSRTSTVGSTNNTLFAHANELSTGFMQIDFLRSGEVRLSVLESEKGTSDSGKEIFSMILADRRTPRGARPVRSEGIWKRARKRAASVWRGIPNE